MDPFLTERSSTIATGRRSRVGGPRVVGPRVVLACRAVAALFLACACSSTGGGGGAKEKIVDKAAQGWFSRILEAIGEKVVEISMSVVAGVVTTIATGGDVVAGLYVSFATLGASFAFRPAQSVTNVDTGGGNFHGGDAGMSFLEYVGLATLVWVVVKYLVIPRSARNFWSGLWGIVSGRGGRGASFRRLVSSTGAAHTSKASARAAKMQPGDEEVIRRLHEDSP